MRVVVITPLAPPFGGVTVLEKALTLALADRGLLQTVITQRRYEWAVFDEESVSYAHDRRAHADLLDRGVAVHAIYDHRERRQAPRGLDAVDADLRRRIAEILEAARPDVVSCHYPSGVFREASRAARDAGIPLVLTLHGMTNLVGRHGSYGLRGLSPDEVVSLVRRSAHGVVVSDEMLEYCQGRGLDNVSMIPGGVDLRAFRPGPRVTRRGVLYVGRALPFKGLREVCEAYLAAERELADDPLLLVGTRIDREAFDRTGFWLPVDRRERFARLVALGQVRLLGEVDHAELVPHYQRARVFVLPSLTEGFAISILEALACGTPVIASCVGGAPAVVKHGWNGYLAPAGAVEQVAEALTRVGELGDGQLATRCRESVLGFSILATAEGYLDLFRRLVAA